MSLSSFTAFLLSPDNSAFADQHGRITHDMTRPLPEYLISASHNTYLVGHQLVGESTVEGYIRALLHSCRSVELDIYDGEPEPEAGELGGALEARAHLDVVRPLHVLCVLSPPVHRGAARLEGGGRGSGGRQDSLY